MKISHQLLNRIIKEELSRVIREQDTAGLMSGPRVVPPRRPVVEPEPDPERPLQLDKDASSRLVRIVKMKIDTLRRGGGFPSGRLEFTFDVEDTQQGSIMKNIVLDDSTNRSLEGFSELRMSWHGDPGVVPAGKYTFVAALQ